MSNAPLDCTLCPRLCTSRRTVVNGVGPKDARIMVVSCNPDTMDEKHGEPLYHRAWAGKKVRKYLLPLAGIDPNEVRYENIVRCNPPRGKKGKAGTPTAKEIETCRTFLAESIDSINPDYIITLGAAALKWFLPDEKISEVHGQQFTVDGRTIIAMLHPDNAKPSYNPKLALVMDQDWRRLGENIAEPTHNPKVPSATEPAPLVADYQIVSARKLNRLMRKAKVKKFAFDFETVKVSNTWEGTFQARRAILLGYSVCWEEGTSYYVDCSKTLNLDHIKSWLEDESIEVIAHNGKYEWIVAKNYGVTITNLHDTKLVAYLLRKLNTGLKSLSWSELGIVQTRYESVDENDMPAFGMYGAEDSDMTLRLFNQMWKEMEESNLVLLYMDEERPLLPVIGRMEMNGVLIDPEPLYKLEAQLNERLVAIDIEIETLYPHPINWRSVPQKCNALFGDEDGGEWKHKAGERRLTYKEWSKQERAHDMHVLMVAAQKSILISKQTLLEKLEIKELDVQINIPLTKLVSYIPPGLGITTKFGTDTDIPTLHKIELAGDVHPIIPLLIERSTITRALSGEIVTLPRLRQEDGRVHCSFHQSGGWEELGGDTKEGTDTGRLSCSGPNLNNITNHGDTSRPYVAEWGATIRTSFVAPLGWFVVKADVGQEEPRIAAYLSGDTVLRDAVNSGDMYLEAAAMAYDKDASEITHEERQIGKRMFMAWLNRAGPGGIQQSAYWLTKQAAQAVINYMATRFWVFEAWCAKQIAFLHQHGYVLTYFDRRVNYPEVWTGNQGVVGKCERACIPAIIQGTAGSILKRIMYRLQTAYDDLELEAELVLPVHDEVVSYTSEKDLDEVMSLHMGLLEGLMPIDLPMEVLVGDNWGEGIEVWG